MVVDVRLEGWVDMYLSNISELSLQSGAGDNGAARARQRSGSGEAEQADHQQRRATRLHPGLKLGQRFYSDTWWSAVCLACTICSCSCVYI